MTSRDDAVVVPAIDNGSSLACVRSLGREGIRTIAVAADDTAPSLRSKYCSERVIAPHPGDDLPGYANALLDLAERPEVRTIVPLRESDIYVLSKHRPEFGEHVATPWPPYGTVRTAQDRRRLLEVATDAGVRVPEWGLLSEWDEWDRPRVIKPRYSFLVDDGDVYFPSVRFTSAGDPPDVDRVVSEMGHEPLVQEYVPGGGEYGFFALFDRGTPVATFQHRRIRSYKYSGGASVFRESVKLPQLDGAGRAVLDALDWHGPAMVEFKRDPHTGEFVLMEVNPRFWGSLRLAVHAGVDFPTLYYRLATGDAESDPPEYDAGVGCHELLGELVYLHDVATAEYDHLDTPPFATELLQVLASVLAERNYDVLSAEDPRPFVRSVANLATAARQL